AHGTILAVTFLFLAWGFWRTGRLVPAGIVAALALLSGPSIWSGLLTLGLTRLLLTGMESKPAEDESPVSDSPVSSLQSSVTNFRDPSYWGELRIPVLSFITTLFLGGTLFFIVPSGLSAWLASIPAYFSGWVTATGVTPARILFTFLAYEPLGLLLAGLAMVRGARTKSRRIV